jgi:hypothetical protein
MRCNNDRNTFHEREDADNPLQFTEWMANNPTKNPKNILRFEYYASME